MSRDEAIHRAKLLFKGEGVRVDGVISAEFISSNQRLPFSSAEAHGDCWLVMLILAADSGKPICPNFTHIAVDATTGKEIALYLL